MRFARNADQVPAKESFQFADAAVEIAHLTAIQGPFGLGALAGLVGTMGGLVARPQPVKLETTAHQLRRARARSVATGYRREHNTA